MKGEAPLAITSPTMLFTIIGRLWIPLEPTVIAIFIPGRIRFPIPSSEMTFLTSEGIVNGSML
jgi:hypothetical protein